MKEHHELRQSMARILQRRLELERLGPDERGRVSVERLAEALEERVGRSVSVDELVYQLRSDRRFELDRDQNRVRARPRPRRCAPDILYHATTTEYAERARSRGVLSIGRGRKLYLSVSESQAWMVAHRFHRRPQVLYVDAGRARREGIRFHRNRTGLYMTDQVPLKHVLNMRAGFKGQLSAGGMLLRETSNGPELALVSCTRRNRSTWEIAKGKLEPGEDPERAACRELQEEMGIDPDVHISILRALGVVRYGFQTPEGEPRLKTLYVYLMKAEPEPTSFTPAVGESIVEVRWFPLDEACALVTHPSLIQLIGRLRQILV